MHLISEKFILRIPEVVYAKIRNGLALNKITLCFVKNHQVKQE